MSDNNGFIDLRIGQGAQGMGDDSVWPSFTDVMTVIVMIFLMALVVIMLRNLELDRELGVSRTEQAAVSNRNEALIQQLSALQTRLLSIEQSLGESEEKNRTLRLNLDEEQRRFQALSVEQDSVQQQLADLLREWQELTELKESLMEQTEDIRNQFSDEGEEPLTINQAIALLIGNNERLEQEKQSLLAELQGATTNNSSLSDQLQAATETASELTDKKAMLAKEVQIAMLKISQLEDREKQLVEQLAALDNELSEKQRLSNQRIGELSQENTILNSQNQELVAENTSLSGRNTELQETIDAFLAQVEETEKLLSELRAEKAELNDKLASLNEQLARVDRLRAVRKEQIEVANEQVFTLAKQLEEGERERKHLLDLSGLSEERLKTLQEEYRVLEEKYKNLVRPARSRLGKFVVEVILLKGETGVSYQYRLPGGELVALQEKAALYKVLDGLKAQYGKQLYTQIIIPDSSDVSHSEAWQFTQEVLNQYDYYSQ